MPALQKIVMSRAAEVTTPLTFLTHSKKISALAWKTASPHATSEERIQVLLHEVERRTYIEETAILCSTMSMVPTVVMHFNILCTTIKQNRGYGSPCVM
jgi:hypothetical protein